MIDKLTIYTDGGARGNPGPAGIGVVIFSKDGEEIKRISKYIGETTNNVAEYSALAEGLNSALVLGGRNIEIKMDSELIVKQIKGEYRVKDLTLKKLYDEVIKILKSFHSYSIVHVYRENNKIADKLVNEALDKRLR